MDYNDLSVEYINMIMYDNYHKYCTILAFDAILNVIAVTLYI